MTVFRICAAAVIAALMLAGCSAPASKDEAGIAAANKKFMDYVAAKDAGGAASMYAEDGANFPPNAPKVEGRDNVRTMFEQLFAAPGFESLTWRTDRLVFASSGDMAVDVGPYEMKMGGSTDIGKTVVVWIKRDGEWKVLTDMFSSDAPATPPPPVAAPAAVEAVPAPADVPVAPPAAMPATAAPPTPVPAPREPSN